MTRKLVKKLAMTNLLLVLFVSLTVFFNSKAVAWPRTTDIIVPDQYSTIQAAIGNASDGDTIFVRSGWYYEHLIVDKSVALVGENKDTTVIDGSYSGIVVSITRNSVNVSGFKITHSGNTWNIGGPPYSAGIFLSGVSYCRLYGNNIVSNGGIGVQAEYGASYNVVADNTIANNGVGVGTFNASWNSFTGNIVTGNDRGFGLNVYSDHNVISGNLVTAFEWVIALHLCNYNTLTDNYVANGQIGIYLPDSSFNQVYHNFVVNNLQQASVYGFPSRFNYWDNNYLSGGNYWSDYSGTDANGDGIGDTAYTIDGNNVDRYPRMHSEMIVPYHFATIQEAINNANDGDTVFVMPGTYHEHVVVNKTVILVGASVSTTIIDGDHEGHVVHAVNSHVNIAGFTVQNGGTVGLPDLDAGIFLDDVTGCVISGNRAINAGFLGISLINSQQNTITFNNVTGSGWNGIRLDNSSWNVISGNILLDNTDVGINCDFSDYNDVTGNVISNNTQGLYWGGANYNRIFNNNISMNQYGMHMEISMQNRIYGNNFMNNIQQVVIVNFLGESANAWDNGYPSGGNYWSDYAGIDVQKSPGQNQPGSDGIGDTPYVCDANNVDLYPLMELYVQKTGMGDVNGDGMVDIYDAILLSNAFNSSPGSPNWNPSADLNSDNIVDVFDAILLAGAFGKKCT